MGPKPKSLKERFERLYKIDASSGCWLWTSKIGRDGYGRLRLSPHRAQKYVLAHRLAYELYRGPIPNGLEMDHLCRVRKCVNPQHLEAVTRKVNLLRGDTILARQMREIGMRTHCPHGHPYDERNTYHHPNGSKVCRICTNEAVKRYNMRKAVRIL